jgi:hypothetical protein
MNIGKWLIHYTSIVLDVVIVSGIFDRQDDLGVGFAPVLM